MTSERPFTNTPRKIRKYKRQRVNQRSELIFASGYLPIHFQKASGFGGKKLIHLNRIQSVFLIKHTLVFELFQI